VNEERLHKKPIGEDGPVRVSAPNGRTSVEWRKIEQPFEKREQEVAIASAFLQSIISSEQARATLVQLDEDDFDFKVIDNTEERYLELQEIVIPGKKRGSPYASGEQVIDGKKFAKTILSAIESKALKYPKGAKVSLDLLVYVTHWRFRPNDSVLKFVALELSNRNWPFARVHFFQRMEKTTGTATTLFPNPEFIKGFRPEHVANYMNFDPAAAEPINKEGQVGMFFKVSADAMKKLGLGGNKSTASD
jgi:hypothetical protein